MQERIESLEQEKSAGDVYNEKLGALQINSSKLSLTFGRGQKEELGVFMESLTFPGSTKVVILASSLQK